MRQTISGLVAAIAVMTAGAAPAMACGGGLFGGSCSPCGQAYVSPCAQPQAYVAPLPTYEYSGCNTGCGGWAHERLPDPEQQYYSYRHPVQQYYHVNQGPTYTGPGNFAPYPTYQEGAVSDWGAYRHRSYHYGYHHAWRSRTSYYHAPRYSYHTRYAPELYHYGHRVLRRYY
jgi:hypothetical protein